MKNPQTTIAPTFLTHIISAIDGVSYSKVVESTFYMHYNVVCHEMKASVDYGIR